MPAEQAPIEEPQDEAAFVRDRFLNDPEAMDYSWDPAETELGFKQLVEQRLRQNHPDLAPKYDGSDALYSLDHDGSMLTAVWLIMIVREDHWRRWQRQQHS